MNIYLNELRLNRRSTIIWAISITALVIFFLSMFPAFSKDAAQVQKLLEGYPEQLRKAIGINVSALTSFLGFYSFSSLYIILCGAVQAMNLGLSTLSLETREKTADFLLTKPVTRQKIVTSKLLAALTSILITNAFLLASSALMSAAVVEEAYSRKTFLLLSLILLFVQLMFLALGLVISVAVPKIKSVLPISLGTVFGSFIINMFGSVIGDKTVRYITPFKYYDAAYIIKNGAYETTFVMLEIVFIVAATIASYVLYTRKDINPV